jgi:SAM-dependent methyltransferase
MMRKRERLAMFPAREHATAGESDPLRFYTCPVIGGLYRRRVELCLTELTGGTRVLEVGFGSGLTFRNLQRKYERVYGIDKDVDPDMVTEFFRGKGMDVDLRKGTVIHLPFPDRYFDSILLISILEHLRGGELRGAFGELVRVLKPSGQLIYGVPVDRRLMRWAFRILGYDIRQHHFSTEIDVRRAASSVLTEVRLTMMAGPLGVPRNIYQVGHFKRV